MHLTTSSTSTISTGGSTTFTQAPVLCSPLTIKANTISITTYITISFGSMPAVPNITAKLSYNGTTIYYTN